MKHTLALLSLLGVAAAQGVTQAIAPDGSYPDGCAKASDGTMWVSVLSVKAAAKRDLLQPRGGECTEGNLVVTLADGVLKDSKDRTGYIASNYQFQFDGPPQAGAISTAGYSLCSNNTIALGPTTTFYQCKSGSFWNLYDRSWAAQCEPVQLAAYKCSASSSTNNGAGAGAGQIGDGQVVGTAVVTTTVVKPIADGQPQVITTEVPVPMCQIGDGQVQAHTTPCASVTAAPPAPSSPAAPVSQYSDGQIQVTPPGPPAASAPPPAAGTTAPAAPAPSAAATPASSPPASASTTLATSPKPSSSAPPAASSAPPASSDAGRVPMASMAALIVGLVAAIAFL